MVDCPVQDETRMIKVFNKYGSDEKVHFGIRQKPICKKQIFDSGSAVGGSVSLKKVTFNSNLSNIRQVVRPKRFMNCNR